MGHFILFFFLFIKNINANFAISLVYSKRHTLNFAAYAFHFKTSLIRLAFHQQSSQTRRNEKWLLRRESNTRKDKKLSGIEIP